MALTCSVCAHPGRAEVDRELSAGASIRDVAGRHGTGRSAVHRHATGCLALTAPADRLRAMVDRAALVEIVGDTLSRARELLDREEARGHTRGVATALTTVLRAVETADRVIPDPGLGADPEMQALILTVAEELDDPAARKVITAGLQLRGADGLAEALAEVWARRPPVLDASTKKALVS